MFHGSEAPIEGRHYRLERPINSPAPLTKPHPPIMIGGMGEKKTLRLVARYADACNLFPTPALPRKLEVLREHCEAAGRDYDSIMKTRTSRFEVGEDGSGVDAVLGQMQWLAGLGIEAVIGGVKDVWKIKPLEIMGREVIPASAAL